METIRTRQLDQENTCLRKALSVALDMLIPHEPPHSCGVSDEFVAMASVQSGDMSPHVMAVIDGAIQRRLAAERDNCSCGGGEASGHAQGCPETQSQI